MTPKKNLKTRSQKYEKKIKKIPFQRKKKTYIVTHWHATLNYLSLLDAK